MSANPQKKTTGLLITFEGIDGSGKSTQLELCGQALKAAGQSVIVTRNPGGTDFGMELRQILLHSQKTVFPMSELLLFIADRAQHMDEVVFPALQAGSLVLCDRHIDSTLAYQGYGRGLPLNVIEELNAIALQGHPPDLTFLFDGESEVLAQRVQKRGKTDRMEAEKTDFHRRVRAGYLALAKQNPHRIHVLNAQESVEDLHQAVMKILNALQPKLPG